MKKDLLDNKGSGLAVIIYGITLMLVFIFTAINIVNAKIIEEGYNSLRDAVQAASSGSVMHLLTGDKGEIMQVQSDIIKETNYDIYLQLALGYLINRTEGADTRDETIVQTGEINNFIKLDHQKVVNTTMALLEDATMRRKTATISNTDEYKILMIFIEPFQVNNKKYFDIIAYGNGDYTAQTGITNQLVKTAVDANGSTRSMKEIYKAVEDRIENIVNCNDSSGELEWYNTAEKTRYKGVSFRISLNAEGSTDYANLIREMETYPHYLIVVKDFALPTIFDGINTNDDVSIFRSAFRKPVEELSGDGHLKTPMCALNTGKVERQIEDADWGKSDKKGKYAN